MQAAESPEYHVACRVRELRDARGWNQTELAQRLAPYGFDMHQTTIAKLERGSRPIRINEAAALADIFEVELVELFEPVESRSGVRDELLHEVYRLRAEVERATRASADAEKAWEDAYRVHMRARNELGRLRADLLEAEGRLHGLHRADEGEADG